ASAGRERAAAGDGDGAAERAARVVAGECAAAIHADRAAARGRARPGDHQRAAVDRRAAAVGVRGTQRQRSRPALDQRDCPVAVGDLARPNAPGLLLLTVSVLVVPVALLRISPTAPAALVSEAISWLKPLRSSVPPKPEAAPIVTLLPVGRALPTPSFTTPVDAMLRTVAPL